MKLDSKIVYHKETLLLPDPSNPNELVPLELAGEVAVQVKDQIISPDTLTIEKTDTPGVAKVSFLAAYEEDKKCLTT